MRQERAEQTRAALVAAAAALFDQAGYERTTLVDISGLAAVSKGALSFHFANKAELADTVQSAGCDIARTSLERLRKRKVPALQTLVDMTHVITRQLSHDNLVRAGVRLTTERETACDSPMHLLGAWYEVFKEVAVEAERDRSLRPDHAPQAVAALTLSLVTFSHAHHRKADDRLRRQLVELWATLLPWLSVERHEWSFRPEGAGS